MSKCHLGAPVAASSAQTTPSVPGRYEPVTLLGTVLKRTVPSNNWGAISMPSCSLRTSVRVHSSFPVFGSSAKASVVVAP